MEKCEFEFFFNPGVVVKGFCYLEMVGESNVITLSNLRKRVYAKVMATPEWIQQYIPQLAKFEDESCCEILAIYKIGEDEYPLKLKSPLKATENVSVLFAWTRDVKMYKYGSGIKSGTARKTSIGSMVYTSTSTYNQFLFTLQSTYPESTFWEAPGKLLTEETFFSTIQKTFTIYVMPNTSCYSDMNLSMILQRVNIPFLQPSVDEMRNIAIADYLKQRDYTSLSYLEKLDISLMLNENGLTKRAAQFQQYLQQHPRDNDSWNDLVDLCKKSLNQLNRTYTPSESFSEAARRVIINPIVMMLSDFFKTTWSVEKKMTEVKGGIGWGLLDYFIEENEESFAETSSRRPSAPSIAPTASSASLNRVVLFDVPDHKESEEDVEEDIIEEAEESTEGKQRSTSSSSEVRAKKRKISPSYNLDIEAKESLEDEHLAQLCGQMLDLWVRQSTITQVSPITVRGVLTNGRKWKFFSLKSATEGGRHPLTLTYDGEQILHILRYSSGTVFNQRLSGLLYNDMNIRDNELQAVLLALAAAYHVH